MKLQNFNENRTGHSINSGIFTGLSKQPRPTPGPPTILRGGHERSKRLGQHTSARLRGKQHRLLVHKATTVSWRPKGRPELRQPDAVPGCRYSRQHGTRRRYQELPNRRSR